MTFWIPQWDALPKQVLVKLGGRVIILLFLTVKELPERNACFEVPGKSGCLCPVQGRCRTTVSRWQAAPWSREIGNCKDEVI